MPCRLNGVGVEKNIVFAGDFANLGNRLNRADLIVREHYRYQNCIGADCGFDVFGVYHAEFVNRQVCDLKTLLLEPVTCV